MKREILVPVVSSLIFISGFTEENHHEPAFSNNEQPNVLLIIANDFTLNLGCYGDDAALTPSIDKLASKGVLFERAYATGTVCTPNRKSLLTGLNIKKVGWGNNNFIKDNPEVMTLPRWFREHGYQTAKIGSVAHTDDYEGPHDWDMNLNKTEKISAGRGPVSYSYGISTKDGNPVMRTRVYPDDQLTLDESRTRLFGKFLETKRDRSKPFFFVLGFHSVHKPNDSNQRHFLQHKTANMPLTIAPDGATPMTKAIPVSFQGYSLNFPEDQQRLAIQGYYASVSMMDEMVGHALAFLDKEGLTDNTIIVFTSDHGFNLGYRNFWAKHIIYPSVLRIPLIISFPGRFHNGSRTLGLVELQDIFPTLTELAKLPTPKELDGISFVPLLEDPATDGKEAVYAQGILHEGSGIAVTTKNGAYMEWDNGKCREFYDLQKDPEAWFNRVNYPEYNREVLRHKSLLHNYFKPF